VNTDFKMQPGRAYYFGLQNSQNELIDPPPEPYVVTVPKAVVRRCWYAAHIADIEWNRQRLVVVLYVDPETRRMYAQPHPDVDARLATSWQNAKVKPWPYEQARDFVRWLELHAMYINSKMPRAKLVPRLQLFWRDYAAGERNDKSPEPLALPRNPEMHFARKGWTDWEAWFWEPPKPKQAEQVPMTLRCR
jgi:hypothetical protein